MIELAKRQRKYPVQYGNLKLLFLAIKNHKYLIIKKFELVKKYLNKK